MAKQYLNAVSAQYSPLIDLPNIQSIEILAQFIADTKKPYIVAGLLVF